MDEKTPPELISLVNEVNEVLTAVFTKHAPNIIDMYEKMGGQKQLDLSLVSKHPVQTIKTLIAINKALMLANRDILLRQELKPEDRGLMWAAKGAMKAVKAMTYPETEQSKARLEVCGGCDQWNGKSCKMCGCYTALKVKIPEEKCPLGKW